MRLKKAALLPLHGRDLTKKDFPAQLLRMIIALGLPMRCVADLEMQRAFWRLDNSVRLVSPSTIKNQIMTRYHEVRQCLLNKLPPNTKVSLALDCWSSYNRQGYMAINAYFIDFAWQYHEVLLGFEHVSGSHTGNKLAQVLRNVLKFHHLDNHLQAITSDNAGNNQTMHSELVEMLRDRHSEVSECVHGIELVPCLAHVIQLALKALLGKIHISPKNDELRKSWDDAEDRAKFEREPPGVPMTLAKVIFFQVDKRMSS